MKEINPYFFDFIYEESLKDATRRTDAVKKNGDDFSPMELVEKSMVLKSIVKNYAESVINGEFPDFCECEKQFEEELDKEKIEGFTFGNTQKLINMTMKRIYFKYSDICREYFKCCHAPMDMKMRDLVCKKYKKIHPGNKLGIENCAWSKIQRDSEGINSIESYNKFQAAISEIISAENSSFYHIEYDYVMWGKDAEFTLPDDNIFIVLSN